MSLPSGKRLGPYVVGARIGAGGMGEVYRATDTRLERTVAIKVLHPDSFLKPEMRRRFEREARTISKISHQNICTLHDIGQEDGIDYLVMEYIEGQTLAKRLEKGPLPLDQILRYGTEICNALFVAHRSGIIHRDLKPGNIMLTKSGAKLLDFGLAKQKAVSDSAASGLVTESGLTQEGAAPGTLAYMSPEQLEGKDVDTRSDIFALGTVLFEMSTGRRPFQNAGFGSLISSILNSDPPPPSSLNPAIPASFDRLVSTCLAKDPDERWQSPRDVLLELKRIGEERSEAGLEPAPAKGRIGWISRVFAGLAMLGVLIAGIVFAFFSYKSRPLAEDLLRLSFLPPEGSLIEDFAISPDGRQLAFTAPNEDGRMSLWVRPLNSLSARLIYAGSYVMNPFWSPDGRYVAFFSFRPHKLMKVEATGGPPETICDMNTSGRGGSWNSNGVILFATSTSPIYRVSDQGGKQGTVTKLSKARNDKGHRWPVFLPDGHHFLYFVQNTRLEPQGIFAGSLESEEEKFVGKIDSNVAFVSPGYLLFWREGNILAQAFNPKKLKLTGKTVIVSEHAQFLELWHRAFFSVSNNGTLVVSGGKSRTPTALAWFDRTGKQLETIGPTAMYFDLKLSHDGRRLAVSIADPVSELEDIWILDLLRGISTRFTFDPYSDWSPVWSPDDTRIVFTNAPTGSTSTLSEKPVSGGANITTLLPNDTFKSPTDWSPDGRYILFSHFSPTSKNNDLWIYSMQEHKKYPYLQEAFNETEAQFSPDGRWIAYVSDESGKSEIYVDSFPQPGNRLQISTSGGESPLWRGDGKELFYFAPDGKMMSVQINAKPTLSPEVPKPLFQAKKTPIAYDIPPDGQRFLLITPVDYSPPLTVVLGWTAVLRNLQN